jgi:DNA-binding XRE family transcriptional regulator
MDTPPKTTQETLAKTLNITRQAVGNYKSGQSSPDFNTLVKIAKYFNVSTDWLLGTSKVRSQDTDLKAVCEYTGLSQKAIELITSPFVHAHSLDCSISNALESEEFYFLISKINSVYTHKLLVDCYLREAKELDFKDLDHAADIFFKLEDEEQSFKYTLYEVRDSFEEFLSSQTSCENIGHYVHNIRLEKDRLDEKLHKLLPPDEDEPEVGEFPFYFREVSDNGEQE